MEERLDEDTPSQASSCNLCWRVSHDLLVAVAVAAFCRGGGRRRRCRFLLKVFHYC